MRSEALLLSDDAVNELPAAFTGAEVTGKAFDDGRAQLLQTKRASDTKEENIAPLAGCMRKLGSLLI